ncbi:MAG: hypothetical protein HC846_02775 [Blastocatellia bacterium]|nr:hypothetical protein [Blastocatellia bacterium]
MANGKPIVFLANRTAFCLVVLASLSRNRQRSCAARDQSQRPWATSIISR